KVTLTPTPSTVPSTKSAIRRHKGQTEPSTNLSSLTPSWNDLASSAGTIRALGSRYTWLNEEQCSREQSSVWSHNYCWGMLSLWDCGNNQIFDRDIDVLNRQFLPVASGEMSGRVAWVIVLLSGIVGPVISYSLSPPEFVHAILTGVLSNAGAFRSIPMIVGHEVLATMLLTRFK
ncbi:hypothetical protein HJC23_008970, partial [Cyclotella cryptica]